MTRMVSRERKWLLPVEEEELSHELVKHDHIDAKVMGQKVEKVLFEAKELALEVKELEHFANVLEEEARGEATPAELRSNQQSGDRQRSPGVQEKRLARLLHFQQGLCELHGLPPSHLQERRTLEDRTSSPSPPSLPKLRPAEGGRTGGRDLRRVFDRIGAEALFPPITSPGVKEGGEEEDQCTRSQCTAVEEV